MELYVCHGLCQGLADAGGEGRNGRDLPCGFRGYKAFERVCGRNQGCGGAGEGTWIWKERERSGEDILVGAGCGENKEHGIWG